MTAKIHNINGDPFRLSHLKKHLGLEEPESARLRKERKKVAKAHVVKDYPYICLGDTHPTVAADYILRDQDRLTGVVVIGITKEGTHVVHTTLGNPGRTMAVVKNGADILQARCVSEEVARAEEGEWWEDPMPNYQTGLFADGSLVEWEMDDEEDDEDDS